MIQPYSDEALNKIYNCLFSDMPELFNSEENKEVYPWNVLLAEDADAESLQQIAKDTETESRIKLLAYNLLSKKGEGVESKELLGVIVEAGLSEGLDVVAAYKDGTARYINYSGKMIIWNTETDKSKQLIDDLFAHSLTVVSKIGAWNKPRLPHPAAGHVKLSFLVADGLYFGMGPFNALMNDEMAAPVIEDAIKLMEFLTESVLQ